MPRTVKRNHPKKPGFAGTLTWAELLATMKNISEKRCLELLDKELATTNRTLWKQRLYQRYSKMRREREHSKYLKGKAIAPTEVDND